MRGVIRQTKARLFQGMTQFPEKIISLFEPHTEIIREGKAGKPNEFGKLVQVQEAENQIITHYEVFEKRPSDQRLLVGAVESTETGPGTQTGGGRCGILFTRKRTGRATDGCSLRIDSESEYAEPRAAETAKDALVQERSKMAYRM